LELLERETGLEPATSTLARWHSDFRNRLNNDQIAACSRRWAGESRRPGATRADHASTELLGRMVGRRSWVSLAVIRPSCARPRWRPPSCEACPDPASHLGGPLRANRSC